MFSPDSGAITRAKHDDRKEGNEDARRHGICPICSVSSASCSQPARLRSISFAVTSECTKKTTARHTEAVAALRIHWLKKVGATARAARKVRSAKPGRSSEAAWSSSAFQACDSGFMWSLVKLA